MSGSREEILGRIGSILGSREVPAEAAYATLERPYLPRHHDSGIIELFAERTADYRASVRLVTAGELPDAVADTLGDGTFAVPAGLPAEWTARVGPARLLTEPALAELDGVDCVLTGCAVAIAETGTIVLDHGPGQGTRALTLVPDRHLIVVTADQVAADVPEALARLDGTRPLTFIAGPSATSDIELDRVEGVHGPRTLQVLVVR